MQISTKTSTQIILNQGEIQEAIIDYVKAKTYQPAGAKFVVEFEDAPTGDLQAVVDISDTILGDTTPVKLTRERGQPSPGKLRRTSAEVAEDDAAENGDANLRTTSGETETVTETPNISENPEDRKDPANPEPTTEEPPFDVDPKTPVIAATPKIFPETSTSAPPKTAEPEPDPAVKAKSLFANLSKPTN